MKTTILTIIASLFMLNTAMADLVTGSYEHETAHCNIYASKGGSHLLFMYSNSEKGLCSVAGESELFELTSGGGGGGKYFKSVRPEYVGTTLNWKFVRIIGAGNGFLISRTEIDAQKANGSIYTLKN